MPCVNEWTPCVSPSSCLNCLGLYRWVRDCIRTHICPWTLLAGYIQSIDHRQPWSHFNRSPPFGDRLSCISNGNWNGLIKASAARCCSSSTLTLHVTATMSHLLPHSLRLYLPQQVGHFLVQRSQMGHWHGQLSSQLCVASWCDAFPPGFLFRFLGPGGGQNDRVWPPYHPSASPVCRHGNSTRGEGSEEGAGGDQGPRGLLLPAPRKGRSSVWPLWKDGEDEAAGLLGHRWSTSRSVCWGWRVDKPKTLLD